MPIASSVLDQITNNDPTLINLVLSFQNLDTDDFINLINALKVNTYITSLDISGNSINEEGIKTLASPECKFTSLIASDCKIKDIRELLKINRLVYLSLASNEIEPESIVSISQNTVLTFVSLAGNNLSDEQVAVLAQTTSITSLILSHNKITAIGAKALANNTSIIHLNLNHNCIESEGVIALQVNHNIRELFVGGNRISISGMKSLATNNIYTTLDVSYNKIGNASAMELLQHKKIVTLNLSYNEISFEGVHSLPEGTPLEHLNISYNFLKDTGIIIIARHNSISHLDASGNRIGFEGTFALARNKVLTTLIYSSNSAGDAGAVILAQNDTLKELIMSYNGVKDAGALSLAANTTLRKLNLNYNIIGDKGKEALLNNKTFEQLILSPEQPPEFTDENLDTIFLLSESFLCICDLSGTLQFFNPAFSRALGLTQDELLGNSFFKYLHPEDKKSLEQQLTLDENIIFYNHENRYQCKDRSFRTISWTSNIIHSRMYAVGTDITDKRRIEKDLLQVEQLTLMHRVLEAENYNKKQREFISHLSHEIRNPLAGIIGLIDSLQEKFKEVEKVMYSLRVASTMIVQHNLSQSFSDINGFLLDMTTCANYQLAILNDNLDLVRLTEKKLTLNNRPFNIKELLLEVLSMFQEKATKKGLTFINEFNQLEATWVKGDYLRFKQIIVNLVGNAIKFTQSGSILIKCVVSNQTEDHLQVTINIVDTGIGLNLTEQGELFRRFSQTVTGESYGGSGIGLYLSRELAHAMGGEISVNSEKAKGSDFCVSMLFETAPFVPVLEQKEPLRLSQLISSELHILVVEDNPTNQKMLCRILDRAKCKWKLANNGQEAVDAVVAAWNDKIVFQAILMDIMMPVMDGLTATTVIRKFELENGLPKTPIIALTANAQVEDRTKGIAAGIDHYFTKPYNAKDILFKIAELSKKNNSATADYTLPILPSPVKLSPRSRSMPQSTTIRMDSTSLDSPPIEYSESSSYTTRMFKPNLTSHSEHRNTQKPTNLKTPSP